MPAVKDNQSALYAHLQRDFAYLDRTGGMAAAHDQSVGTAYTGGWTTASRKTAVVCIRAMPRATWWPATPPDWNRAWPSGNFVNALTLAEVASAGWVLNHDLRIDTVWL